MERKLNKKLILSIIKYGNWLIAFGYFIQIILSCFGYQSFILCELFSVSLLPIVLLCLFSTMLGYCIWNRMPLYYVIFINIINSIDFYIGIPVSYKIMFMIYLIILGLFILIGSLIKNNKNVNKRNIKNNVN